MVAAVSAGGWVGDLGVWPLVMCISILYVRECSVRRIVMYSVGGAEYTYILRTAYILKRVVWWRRWFHTENVQPLNRKWQTASTASTCQELFRAYGVEYGVRSTCTLYSVCTDTKERRSSREEGGKEKSIDSHRMEGL